MEDTAAPTAASAPQTAAPVTVAIVVRGAVARHRRLAGVTDLLPARRTARPFRLSSWVPNKGRACSRAGHVNLRDVTRRL